MGYLAVPEGAGPFPALVIVHEWDDPETMIANMNAAVAYLRSRSDVTGRVGAMGRCFGGGIALSFGLDGENHEAAALYLTAMALLGRPRAARPAGGVPSRA